MRYLFLICGLALGFVTGAPAGPTTLRPLFTADSTTPPLVVVCGGSGATTPLWRYPDPGDTLYQAQGVVTGPGTLTLVVGVRSASIRTPCAPCLVQVTAPPWTAAGYA